MNILNKSKVALMKNHFIFMKNNIVYFENMIGDERLNIFNVNLMNIYLEKFEDLIGEVVYDDIIEISTIENHDKTIRTLPKKLRKLFVMSSMCDTIILSPNVKKTIEYLHIDHSNIGSVPDISNCTNLISFKINHSNISQFSLNYDLPPKLIEINLSNNMITNNEFSYDKIIEKLNNNTLQNIAFTDNHLNYDLFPVALQRKVKLIRQKTYKFNRINFRNVGIGNIRNYLQVPVSTYHLLASSQTVHLSSINQSVIKSIEIMKQFMKDNQIPLNNLFEDTVVFKNFIDKHNTYSLDKDLKLGTVQSTTNLTYKKTFALLWAIMRYLIEKGDFKEEDIYERLITELEESDKVCFTGKYNRLINSLVGILEGVNVGISSKEEIQLEFGKIMERLNKNKETDKYYFSNAVCEANQIFVHSDNSEKSIWMEALFDLAPDPIKIKHANEEYYQTWDSIILDIYSKTQVGLFCEQSEQIMFCKKEGNEEDEYKEDE
jgi:hypothetical protein